jgi:tetratricopeptide (TPR) repeat protein
LILSFAVLALVVLVRRTKGATGGDALEKLLPYYFALPYAGSILIFFITTRYRLPIAVALIPPAAYVAVYVWHLVKERAWSSVVRCALVVVPVSVLSCANPYRVGAHAPSRGYYELGVDYTNTDIAKALDSFDRSISVDSSYAPAWKMRGWCYDQLGQPADAVRDLRIACSLDSQFADAFFTLGVVYQKMGKHDEAETLYQRVLDLDAHHIAALNNTADILMRRGMYEAALPYLNRVLELDPSFDYAVYGLGFYHEKTGDASAAERMYMRILHVPAARMRLVLMFKKQGRVEDAVALLERMARAYPEAPDIDRLKKIVVEGLPPDSLLPGRSTD